jgi:hypothetical protein
MAHIDKDPLRTSQIHWGDNQFLDSRHHIRIKKFLSIRKIEC